MKKHILNFSMSIDLWEKIKTAAGKIGSSATQYIRLAIIEKLDRDNK